LRRALGALLLALGRDPGVTLIETDRWTLAEELWSFGEDSLYPVALQLSDEDMVRLWLLAGPDRGQPGLRGKVALTHLA